MAESDKKPGKANHLIREKSPYLLQHAENPVDWHPWGEAAFQKAKEEDKPIFLSIGYATCHWCHVMAHESFEDEEVALLLNQSFVSIKVDREERPDVDHIYMSVCQALTGQGGWPLSIFMTPEGNPFFAGTYFPRTGRMGLMGFTDLLRRIATLWRGGREKILESSGEIRQVLGREAQGISPGPSLDKGVLRKGYAQFHRTFDETWGGFGGAPKFPTPHHLTFLLRWHRRSGEDDSRRMVEKTLEAMRRGGIFDHLGLGFHRYSVDEKWLIPHFEKMLYDQALLAMAYTEAGQALGKEEYGRAAREIFTYVLRDMTSPEGAFYSAEDADSEGHEGLFYVWRPEEIKRHLGKEEGDLFCRFYGVSPEGNFEDGASVLHIPRPLENFAAQEKMETGELEKILKKGRKKLFQVREKRIHPLKDDKILTSWNGLMIAALAKGFQALQDPGFSAAACRAADFILERLRTPQGRLYRRYREGEAAIFGFLEDYAFLVWGLIELHEATFQVRYLEEALRLNRMMIEFFWDEEKGGFYFSGRDNEALIARPKELYDGATPSGNSVAALNLLRLARMTGKSDLEEKTERLVQAFSAAVAETPMAFTQFLNFLDFYLGPGQEIVLAGDPGWETSRAMTAAIQQKFHPNKILLFRAEDDTGEKLAALCPFVKGMKSIGQKATAYLCEGYSCKTPLTDPSALWAALK
jgi:uncharacterized protein YyaL (SSP411 family)